MVNNLKPFGQNQKYPYKFKNVNTMYVPVTRNAIEFVLTALPFPLNLW
jgi:hypothetical protein